MGRNGVKRQKQLRLYSCNGAKEALLFYTSIMSMSIIVNMDITVSDFHGMIIAAKKLLWTMLSVKFSQPKFIVCVVCLLFTGYQRHLQLSAHCFLFHVKLKGFKVKYTTHTHTHKNPFQSSFIITLLKCVVVAVSADTLQPAACIFLFSHFVAAGDALLLNVAI